MDEIRKETLTITDVSNTIEINSNLLAIEIYTIEKKKIYLCSYKNDSKRINLLKNKTPFKINIHTKYYEDTDSIITEDTIITLLEQFNKHNKVAKNNYLNIIKRYFIS